MRPIILHAGSAHRRLLALLSVVSIVIATLMPPGSVPSALAQTAVLPTVTYDAFAKTIFIGGTYADPAFAGYPSRSDAPKDVITIPQLKTALDALGQPGLLVDQGSGNWLLLSDVLINQTARLEVTDATIKWLRLDSTPNRFPAFTRLVAEGGQLLIQKVKVSSWDTNANNVDTNYFDGRSYMLADTGGRMDIIQADVSYLGYSDGEPSGMAWRKRATTTTPDDIPTSDLNILRTGSTGSILNSDIHNNYFGQYSYEAYGLIVKNNTFHNNAYYGFDPHDYSFGFEVAYNEIFNNGKHGIIFSRGCEQNWIHNNVVYGNAQHGIMLDRGSNNNKISDNESYNNSDGVAIFESSNNLVQNNNLHDNERGVRINATYDVTDVFDANAVENVVIGNTIRSNSQYGIYLYERADKNTIVSNVIDGNKESGIYVKTGENKIQQNEIRTNGVGVTIIGSEPYTGPPASPPATAPAYVQPESAPGEKNTLYSNIIEDNDNTGVQIKQGTDNLIGPKNIAVNPEYGNQLNNNGSYGITLDTTSTENTVVGNTIHANVIDGALISGPESIDNRISRNSIAVNGRRGISISQGADLGIPTPIITSAPGATTVTGTALPKGEVEIYRDANGQGNIYKGTATVDAKGNWSFPLPANDNPNEGSITALAFDKAGNTSQFGGTASTTINAIYELGTGVNGDLTVYVSGPGANVTLPMIQAGVKTLTTTNVLENQGSGVWQSNASLFINRGVTLTLTTDTASWLKLRSQGADIKLTSSEGDANYNYHSFVTLRTYGGSILIDGVRITSWDPDANTYDTDIENGRSYLLAKYDARMDVKNADLSYLGSSDGESYGVAWRDINSSDAPDQLQTRVTGTVINSTFSYNYYGIYTFQARDMVFQNNKFHNNIGYGFDPHDLSHNFLIEDNESFDNGNHGFIISRGCNNFTFRRNKSYNNHYTVGNADRNAQGFMLDPGSPNSQFPQVPSHDNVFEDNQAWGNSGYGLRIVGSINNRADGNIFTNNLQGITAEQGSTGNTFTNNTITGSGIYGIYLIGGSDNTTITGNTITKSGKHGIYIKTGGNTISKNIISGNGTLTSDGPTGAGIATLPDSDLTVAAADLTLPGSHISLAASDPDLLGSPTLTSELKGNVISQNTITSNIDDGIEIKGGINTTVSNNTIDSNGTHGVYITSGSTGTMVQANTISRNKGHGIRTNGSDSFNNTWTKNIVYNNGLGGIVNTSDANNDVQAPVITSLDGKKLKGTATPGAHVELYSDTGGQGLYYETSVVAKADGTFSATRTWKAANVNAIATDADGNSSGFTYNVPGNAFTIYLPIVTH